MRKASCMAFAVALMARELKPEDCPPLVEEPKYKENYEKLRDIFKPSESATETGLIVHENLCFGCGNCVVACPPNVANDPHGVGSGNAPTNPNKLVMAAFESAELAGKAVVKTFSSGVVPSACEILDRVSLQVLKRYDPNLVLPAEGDVILFEVDGTETSAREAAEQVMEVCSPLSLTIKLVESEKEMADIWAARKLVGAAVSRLDPTKTRIYVGEDMGVPMKQILKLLRRVQEISEEFDLPAMKYGHIGDGNLHLALFIDVLKHERNARKLMAFLS